MGIIFGFQGDEIRIDGFLAGGLLDLPRTLDSGVKC